MIGNPKPRISCLPADIASTAAADDAIEVSALAGLNFDPWQRLSMKCALGTRADGKWAASEVGIVVPRQNGKGSIIEGRELAGLFVYKEDVILHSAHEFKTARQGFLRIQYLIQQSPFFTNKIKKVATAHGSEGIELIPDETIIMAAGKKFVRKGKAPVLYFIARSGGSGRGFTGDVIFLDEAYRLPDHVMTALLPVLSARPNPQIWYTSSAVNQEEHDQGENLTRVRVRGVNRSSPRLCYLEWSADENEYDEKLKAAKREGRTWRDVAGSEEMIIISNPGVGHRITEDAIETELHAFREKAFKVERLGIGDWPDVDEDPDTGPISRAQWAKLRDDEYNHGEHIVFAIDVSVDRSKAAIVAFSEDEFGKGHIELVEYGSGTRWIIPWLKERIVKWKPIAIGIDGKSPTASLIADMERAGIKRPRNLKRPRRGDLIVLNLSEMADACGQFLDAVADEKLKYFSDADLDSAVHGAELRKVGDVHVWGRRDLTVDVSPLTAGTIARWTYLTHKDALTRRAVPMVATF